jgi:hypothetical protein
MGGTECYGYVVFLARALLKSRTGFQKSDSVVNYLTRRVIQIGLLAALWVVAALGTWFLLPETAAYRILDITTGPVYTHVSSFFLPSNMYYNDV